MRIPLAGTRWRQSAYHTMAWNMGRIKANVEGTHNKDQVVEAASVVQAIANSKISALFQPGSNAGKGCHDKFREEDKK